MDEGIRTYLGMKVIIRDENRVVVGKRTLREDRRGYYCIINRKRVPVWMHPKGHLIGLMELASKPYEEGKYNGNSPIFRHT